MGRTTASGFVIGRGTVSDLSQESSHEGLLLLRLWACGQGGRVVEAKRHVHSPRVENARATRLRSPRARLSARAASPPRRDPPPGDGLVVCRKQDLSQQIK